MDFKQLFAPVDQIKAPVKSGDAVLEDDGLYHFSKICSELNIDTVGFRKALYRLSDEELEGYGVRRINGKWAVQMEKFRKVVRDVRKKFTVVHVEKLDPEMDEDAFFKLNGTYFLADVLKSPHMPVEDPPFRGFLRENKRQWKALGISLGRKKYLIELPKGFLVLAGFVKRHSVTEILEQIADLEAKGEI